MPLKPVPSVIWMRPTRGSRGPFPSRDRDAIARVAIGIADREGLAAASMRRIAAEVGGSTSSLYRYFARKDDLMNLMVDAALGVEPDAAPSGDWRADLALLAHALRGRFLAHPWLATALAGRPTLGPNRLAALEATLAVLEPSGLPAAVQLSAIDTVTAYVRGFVAEELASAAAIAGSGLSAAQWNADQSAYTATIASSGRYPRVTALFGALHSPDPGESFAAGLAIVLGGITAAAADPLRRT